MKPNSLQPSLSAFKRCDDGRLDLAFRGLKCLPRVSSLLFELELEDVGGMEELDCGSEAAFKELRSLAEPWSETEQRLARIVQQARDEAVRHGTVVDLAALGSRLRGAGFDVKLRNALGGGQGGECLRNLRHSFLAVAPATPSAASPPQRLIVDLHFREQFEIATPTPRYAALLDGLPSEFAGDEARAALLVEFMCREMSAAFKAVGKTLPPWRQAEAMLSKWRPRRSVEHDVPSPVLPPGRGGAAAERQGGALYGSRPPTRALFAGR